MSESQSRLLLLLGLLAVVATAVRVFWEPGKEPFDPDATSLVWDVELPNVTAVTVERDGGVVSLEKRGDDWWITRPIEAPAESGAVHDLLDMLQEVDAGIEVPDADPVAFGIEPEPVAVVTVRDGGEPKVLVVGTDAPVGRRTYVRAANGEVAAVVGRLERDLPKDARNLRDKAPFRMLGGDVGRVSIASPDGTLVVYEVDDRWWVEGFTRARPSRVDELVGGLLDLRFDDFPDAGVPDSADWVYEVTLRGVEAGAQTMRVGELFPGLIAVQSDRVGLGNIQGQHLALLTQGPGHVGDDRAFPVDPLGASDVELHLGPLTARVKRDGWQWTVAEGAIPLDDPHAFLRRVHNVPIHYRLAPVPQIASEWGNVIVHGDEGPNLQITVGQLVDDEYRVAKDDMGGEPYLVPVKALDALLAGEEVPWPGVPKSELSDEGASSP